MRTLAMRSTASRTARLLFDPGHWLLGFSFKAAEGIFNVFLGPLRFRVERNVVVNPLSAVSAYAGPIVTTFENEQQRMT